MISTDPSALEPHPLDHVFIHDVIMRFHDAFDESRFVVKTTLTSDGSGKRKHGDDFTPRDTVFKNKVTESR